MFLSMDTLLWILLVTATVHSDPGPDHMHWKHSSGNNLQYGSSYYPRTEYSDSRTTTWDRPLKILQPTYTLPRRYSSRPLFNWDDPVPMAVPIPASVTTTAKAPWPIQYYKTFQDVSPRMNKNGGVGSHPLPELRRHQDRRTATHTAPSPSWVPHVSQAKPAPAPPQEQARPYHQTHSSVQYRRSRFYSPPEETKKRNAEELCKLGYTNNCKTWKYSVRKTNWGRRPHVPQWRVRSQPVGLPNNEDNDVWPGTKPQPVENKAWRTHNRQNSILTNRIPLYYQSAVPTNPDSSDSSRFRSSAARTTPKSRWVDIKITPKPVQITPETDTTHKPLNRLPITTTPPTIHTTYTPVTHRQQQTISTSSSYYQETLTPTVEIVSSTTSPEITTMDTSTTNPEAITEDPSRSSTLGHIETSDRNNQKHREESAPQTEAPDQGIGSHKYYTGQENSHEETGEDNDMNTSTEKEKKRILNIIELQERTAEEQDNQINSETIQSQAKEAAEGVRETMQTNPDNREDNDTNAISVAVVQESIVTETPDKDKEARGDVTNEINEKIDNIEEKIENKVDQQVTKHEDDGESNEAKIIESEDEDIDEDEIKGGQVEEKDKKDYETEEEEYGEETEEEEEEQEDDEKEKEDENNDEDADEKEEKEENIEENEGELRVKKVQEEKMKEEEKQQQKKDGEERSEAQETKRVFGIEIHEDRGSKERNQNTNEDEEEEVKEEEQEEQEEETEETGETKEAEEENLVDNEERVNGKETNEEENTQETYEDKSDEEEESDKVEPKSDGERDETETNFPIGKDLTKTDMFPITIEQPSEEKNERNDENQDEDKNIENESENGDNDEQDGQEEDEEFEKEEEDDDTEGEDREENSSEEESGEDARRDTSCGDLMCDQDCEDSSAGPQCTCYEGFVMQGVQCIDVNECEIENGGCEGSCRNTRGSRLCGCPSGYQIHSNGRTCLDINECLHNGGRGPCQDRCNNTDGSYSCSCVTLHGTTLSSDGHTCSVLDDCTTGAAGCSHLCIYAHKQAFCTCPDGLELGNDWKTCRDIDECEDGEVCERGCVNTIGSYYCTADDENSNQVE